MTKKRISFIIAVAAIFCFCTPGARAQTDSIRHKVFFESGSYNLDNKAVKFIDSVAGRLNRYARYKIYLHGHTDDVGSPEANLALANKRVETVLAKLRLLGIDSSRVLGKSSGEDNPLFPNTTEQNRSLNRRVDISVVRWDKDTLIKLSDCGEIFVPKGAFYPLMIEDIDFGATIIDNQKSFASSGLPANDAAGNLIWSGAMLQWKTLVSGKPAKRNPKRSIEFRLCNKYGLDKVNTYCLKTVNGVKVWELITLETKIENGKIMVKLPSDCESFNFATQGRCNFKCCDPFILEYLPVKNDKSAFTENFAFSHQSSSKIDFTELTTTCDRIQANVQENISDEQYFEKARYFQVRIGKSKNLETVTEGKVYFTLTNKKQMPAIYTYNEETSLWEEYNGKRNKVINSECCDIYSLSVTGTGIYALVDSMGTFEKKVNLKTKKYKPETVYMHYKPALKKGRKNAIVNGPSQEHFFKFNYATSIPVIGDNNNNTIIIADTDNPEAMKVSRKKVTDLRYKRKKQLYLVKKKMFESTTDAAKETAKLCKGKKRR